LVEHGWDMGASMGAMGASMGDMGASMGDMGASMGDMGASMGDMGASIGGTWVGHGWDMGGKLLGSTGVTVRNCPVAPVPPCVIARWPRCYRA
jgi:hypothetical protein